MKLKIALCDDEKEQREYLCALISKWAKRKNHLAELQQYPGSEAFLFDYEEKKDLDILLLDVEMPGKNGIEVAKTVRKHDQGIQIIFVTGFYEYFSDGFDVSALHYLIKPVDEDKLYPVLDKAVENLRHRERSVLIPVDGAQVRIPLADILYIQAQNTHINICTADGEPYLTRMSLAKFMESLDDTFFKVHRSYVVSLKFIKKITKPQITMENGDEIPMSRGLYGNVHEALIRFL